MRRGPTKQKQVVQTPIIPSISGGSSRSFCPGYGSEEAEPAKEFFFLLELGGLTWTFLSCDLASLGAGLLRTARAHWVELAPKVGPISSLGKSIASHAHTHTHAPQNDHVPQTSL